MILFKRDHVPLIMADEKTQTRRLGRRRWNAGSVHIASTSYRNTGHFARLLIRDVREELLGDISVEDAWAEGHYTPMSYMQTFQRINRKTAAEMGVLLGKPVWVVTFSRIPACPNCGTVHLRSCEKPL